MTTLLSSLLWPTLYAILLLTAFFVLILPAYTFSLAALTIARAHWHHGRRLHNHRAVSTAADISSNKKAINNSSPWKNIQSTIFRGTVYHIRHQPVVHAFKYPMYFSVVDLEESSDLFGSENVAPCDPSPFAPGGSSTSDSQMHDKEDKQRGMLWPLSTLMTLKDEDHLKNGEGLMKHDFASSNNEHEDGILGKSQQTQQQQQQQQAEELNEHATTATKVIRNKSMKQRVFQLVYERTRGKLDLRTNSSSNSNRTNNSNDKNNEGRRVLLVTHLQYYGYCFNPISLFYILKPKSPSSDQNNNDVNGSIRYIQNNDSSNDDVEDETIEAIVVEVSNTPWNEMSIYVLHPESVDILEHRIYPASSSDDTNSNFSTNASSSSTAFSKKRTTYHYIFNKTFHVSPFMTMDHLYDWKFQLSRNYIQMEAKMRKFSSPQLSETDGETASNANDNGSEEKKNDNYDHTKRGKSDNTPNDATRNTTLFFTGGFTIHRPQHPSQNTFTFPLQLAQIISRFPIYCFLIQVWIHYEALKLLMKGVEFIPHPQGSESGASKAIAWVMSPVFWLMDWWDGSGGDGKKAKSD